MFHCQAVKYKSPIQSHFVNQYHGGQLGQRDLWYLGDQSFDSEQSSGLVRERRVWTSQHYEAHFAGSHEIKVNH